jgi:tellurite resistance protein TehA-like permease
VNLGFSLGIFALGAILKFAITDNINGIDLPTVGVILMIVGAIGFVISLVLMLMRRRTDVIHENGYADGYPAQPAPGARRTTYIEPNDRY